MEYVDGITLSSYISEVGQIDYDTAVCLLLPVIRSLGKLHEEKMLHRDISPDNIMLVGEDVKLIDFGAARYFENEHSLSVMIKHGYSPIEQYKRHGEQGPWTDIYSLCATIYKCITGKAPDDAVERLYSDTLVRPSSLGISIDGQFEDVLMKGLMVRSEDRWKSMDDLLKALEEVPALGMKKQADTTSEPKMMRQAADISIMSADTIRTSRAVTPVEAEPINKPVEAEPIKKTVGAEPDIKPIEAGPSKKPDVYYQDSRLSFYLEKKRERNKLLDEAPEAPRPPKQEIKKEPEPISVKRDKVIVHERLHNAAAASSVHEPDRKKKPLKPMEVSSSETIYYKPQKTRDATLLIVCKDKMPTLFPLRGSMTMGRDYERAVRDIRIKSQIVSREHGEFIFDDSDGSYYYIDNNSCNGTFINGVKLPPYNQRGSKAVKLSDGDIIRIDQENLSEPHPEAVLIIFSTTFSKTELWRNLDIEHSSMVTVGRGDECTLKLNDLMMSKNHAMLFRQQYRWFIKDNDSTNGICLNGTEIQRTECVFPNDVIRLGGTTLIFKGNSIIYNVPDEKRASLVIDIAEKRSGSGSLLLKDIYADIYGGDFVLVLGGSDTDKNTFIKTLLGDTRANGRIIVNGQDLHSNRKSLRPQIGMAPLFRPYTSSNTVREVLTEAANRSLGRSYSKSEKLERVEKVILQAGIKEYADMSVRLLNAGQQRKVAIAERLMGFQKVFIYDDTALGLDEASEGKQMTLLKDISRKGKIVLVLTGSPDEAVEISNGERNIMFTKVLVLARDSVDNTDRLAYFGTVHGAMSFFGTDSLSAISRKLSPLSDGGAGQANTYIEKYKRTKKAF